MSDVYEIKAFRKSINKYGKMTSTQETVRMKSDDTFETMLDKAILMRKSDSYSDVFLYRVLKIYEPIPIGCHAVEEDKTQCHSR